MGPSPHRLTRAERYRLLDTASLWAVYQADAAMDQTSADIALSELQRRDTIRRILEQFEVLGLPTQLSTMRGE